MSRDCNGLGARFAVAKHTAYVRFFCCSSDHVAGFNGRTNWKSMWVRKTVDVGHEHKHTRSWYGLVSRRASAMPSSLTSWPNNPAGCQSTYFPFFHNFRFDKINNFYDRISYNFHRTMFKSIPVSYYSLFFIPTPVQAKQSRHLPPHDWMCVCVCVYGGF